MFGRAVNKRLVLRWSIISVAVLLFLVATFRTQTSILRCPVMMQAIVVTEAQFVTPRVAPEKWLYDVFLTLSDKSTYVMAEASALVQYRDHSWAFCVKSSLVAHVFQMLPRGRVYAIASHHRKGKRMPILPHPNRDGKTLFFDFDEGL